LIDILKSRGSKLYLCGGTPDFTTNEEERAPEIQTKDCVLIR
jgi:hypothetical protein